MLLIEQENEETNFKLQKISVVNNVEIYTYFFVVIQHSIHVFDPDSVNGTIKNYPLSVRSFCGREFSERFSHNTVTPLKHENNSDSIVKCCTTDENTLVYNNAPKFMNIQYLYFVFFSIQKIILCWVFFNEEEFEHIQKR